MNVSIGGLACCGKGTIGRMICERFKLEFISVGDAYRKLAEEMGLSLKKATAPTFHTLDEKVDKWIYSHAAGRDRCLYDGRLTWKFAPHSFKILIHCDLDERVKRYLDRPKSTADPDLINPSNTQTLITQRDFADLGRYRLLYGIDDFVDISHFDLAINSTRLTAQKTADAICRILDPYFA